MQGKKAIEQRTIRESLDAIADASEKLVATLEQIVTVLRRTV